MCTWVKLLYVKLLLYATLVLDSLYSGSEKYSNILRNFLLCIMLYTTFWNYIGTVGRHDCRDYIGKIWNGFENLYRSYELFIGTIHICKVFGQSVIYYINKLRYLATPSLALIGCSRLLMLYTNFSLTVCLQWMSYNFYVHRISEWLKTYRCQNQISMYIFGLVSNFTSKNAIVTLKC